MVVLGYLSTYKKLSSVICHAPVSNYWTPVSKNHTLYQHTKIHIQLIINQIKVWHGFCSTISENELITRIIA